MAKIIRYQYLSAGSGQDSQENSDAAQLLLSMEIHCQNQAALEANLPIVIREAYQGKYTVEDDGEPEVMTEQQRIVQLEEALELLLSGVTQ